MDKLSSINKIKNWVGDAMTVFKKQWGKFLIYWGKIKQAEYVVIFWNIIITICINFNNKIKFKKNRTSQMSLQFSASAVIM